MAKKLPKEPPGQKELAKEVKERGYTTVADLIRLQELRLEHYYKGAPTIPAGKTPSGTLKWREFVPLTAEEFKSLSKDDKDRLTYWFNEWSKPVSSYAARENVTPQRVFFGIVKEKTGLDRDDFNWPKYRRRYFKVNPDRYGEFKKTRKGKKK